MLRDGMVGIEWIDGPANAGLGGQGGGSSGVVPSPTIPTGQSSTVNKAVIPYMRAIPIALRGMNLRPYSNVQHWVDDTNVNTLVQPASTLTVNTGFSANVFAHQEGIYCNTSHAYAVVLEYSTGGVLHIDENYVCLNLNTYGPLNSNTFVAGSYASGDIVYQTADNSANVYANTFVGRVAYWASQDGAIAVIPDYGTFANSAANCVLFKVGSTQLANVANVVLGNKFPTGASITSINNVSKIFTANGWNHNHGVVSLVSGTANQLKLSGNISATAVNSIIQIVAGLGIGQNAKINSITSNNIITLNTSWVGHSGNSFYAIGNTVVDGIGLASSILRIPEDSNFRFQTGSRLITMNDGASATDNAATMYATATFVAAGGITTTRTATPTVPPTPIISAAAGSTVSPVSPTTKAITNNGVSNNPAASADPLVQTFFTPKPTTTKVDSGIFATSIDLFFQNKPLSSSSQFPVSVYIVQTDNGFPTTQVIGSATVRWEDIKTTDGLTTFPDAANTSTSTNFKFKTPVYLSPGTEYGIVVYSESPDYEIWIADVGQTVVNSTRLVSDSPYVGSLFKSQNASTWTPILNEQLMFKLNKAAFSTTPTTLLFNVAPQAEDRYLDQLMVHSSDVVFPAANIAYGIKTIVANTLTQDGGFYAVNTDTPFSFGADLQNSSLSNNRRRIIPAGNSNGLLLQVTMTTTDPDVSPFFHSERLSAVGMAYMISPGGISNDTISILTGGAHVNAANIVVTIDAPTGDGGIQAAANVLANGVVSGNLVAINITNPGAGYVISPNITITEAAATSNATAVITAEDGQTGGNGQARYVTRQITLADGFDAGDLNVFMTAIRPQGTDISVYYKVISAQDSDVLTNKKWKLMNKTFDTFSTDQLTPVQLHFNTGYNALGIANGAISYVENGVTYPIGGKFKSFKIKIVLTANDPTVTPVVKNFRAIAVPSG